MEYSKLRRRPGEVRDAIFTFLESEGGCASVGAIVDGVVATLDGDCSPSSVRSYLALNEGSAFVRVKRGQYALPEAATEYDSQKAYPIVPAITFGSSTLFEADCFDWLERQPPNSIQAVVTDPPYGLIEYSDLEQRKLRSGRGGVWRIPPSFDGHQRAPLPRFSVLTPTDIGSLESFFRRWGRLLLPVLTPGAHVFVASNPLVSYAVSSAIVAAGFERRGEIVRLVMTMRGGDRPKNAHNEFSDVTVMPRSMYEPWLVFRKPIDGRVQDNLRKWKTGGLRRRSAEQPFGDVIVSHPTRPRERAIAAHPSLKPQAFLRQIVRASLPLGEGVVLDPFAGSGSTLAAAEAVGYASIGVEKDPHYVEVARKAVPQLATFKVSG